jgi:hypothetical protein
VAPYLWAPLAAATIYATADSAPIWIPPAVFIGIGSVGTAILIGLRREMWILSVGRPAIGRVLSSKKIKRGKHNVLRVNYEFVMLSGAKRIGRFDVEKDPPKEASELIVLYDPENPSRQIRYPGSLARCVTTG